MTITVTDLEAGPFVATGALQVVPYDFMTLGDDEIEVVVGDVALNPALYSVDRNTFPNGDPDEGGSVSITASALAVGASFFLRAAPKPLQPQVWSDSGSRLRNLNEALDRLTLLAITNQTEASQALIASIAAAASEQAAETALAQILFALANPVPGSAVAAALVGLNGGGNLQGAVANTLFTSQFPSLNAALSAWMLAGGTLVVNQDIVTTQAFSTGDGTMLVDKDYVLTTLGARTITYAGADVVTFLRFYFSGRANFVLSGNLTIDCTNKAGTGLWIDTQAVSGTNRRDCTMSGFTIKNCRLATYSSAGANGLRINGGFRKLVIRDFVIRDITLGLNTGEPGSWGVAGLVMFGNDTLTTNPQSVLIEDFWIENITSEEVPGGARWSDSDGILMFYWRVGTDTVAPPVIRKGTIIDAFGRAIKRFCPVMGGVTENITVFRKVRGKPGGSQEVVHQDGSGTIRNIKVVYTGDANLGTVACVPIGMSLGYQFDPGPTLIENILVDDATGVVRPHTITIFDNQASIYPKQHTIRNVYDKGLCETFVNVGALGLTADAQMVLENINVNISQGITKTDDHLYFLKATLSQFINRNATAVPAVIQIDGVTPKALRWGDWATPDGSVKGLVRYTGLWRGNSTFKNGVRGPGGGVENVPAYGTSETSGRVTLPAVINLAAGATWNGPAAGLYADKGGDYSLSFRRLDGGQGLWTANTYYNDTAFYNAVSFSSIVKFVNGGASTGVGTDIEIWKDMATQAIHVTNRTASTISFQITLNY